ncbi:MAG TPA: hypothetical protein VEW67_06935 [Thermoleophilaceae bacterium]|nr:hypothetical protein [Thermoleophilaceae bacterium]
MACVEDLGVVSRAAEIAGMWTCLAAFDYDDSQEVGGPLRRTVAEYLERIRELLEDSWELALFEVSGPGAQLRDEAIAAGRWGAEIVDVLLRALVAGSPSEAEQAAVALQELLDRFWFFDRLDALADEANESAELDDNARIARVVGRTGNYVDEFGTLDVQAVLGAYADQDAPLDHLARDASRYLEAIFAPAEARDDGAYALLVLPAVMLATLDRPLLAYRAARLTYDLLLRAWGSDSAAVRMIVSRATDEAPRLLAASSRIQQSFRLLAYDERGDEVDDVAAVTTGLNAYQEVAESAYRMLGHMVLDLDRVARGGSPSPATADAPMIGSLTQELTASDDPAARELGAACDSALRNAIAHSQYRWDPQAESVHDLKTGETWDADTLQQSMHALIGAVTGADASWACFVVASDLELSPSWATDGSAPEATLLLAALGFSSRGFHVRGVEDDGATVVIEPPDTIDPSRLIPGLGGMAVNAPKAARYRVKSADDHTVLLEVAATALWQALNADAEVQDLAIVETTVSAMIAAGWDQTDAIEEIATLEAKVVAVTGMQVLAEAVGPSALEVIRRRLAHLREFIATSPHKRRALNNLRDKLARAEATAVASAIDDVARRRLVDQLTGLCQWADQRGINWPPSLERPPAREG